LGCIAFGIGTSQVKQVLAAQSLILKRPKTMQINVEGTLSQGVGAKDVVLYIISQLGAEGATEHFIEFSGAVFQNMSIEERMTVCNMSIEMGARGGLVPCDDTTISYLKKRITVSEEIEDSFRSFGSDIEASFDKAFTFFADDIAPMITSGPSPDTGISINKSIAENGKNTKKGLDYMQFSHEEKLLGKKIDYVFIGSCTNSRIEDLREVAKMAKNRKKAANVNVWVVPGSNKVRNQAIKEGLDQIFLTAGFEFREPGCSACLAMNEDKIPDGALCVSTSNRNFEGRQGKGARTILASPLTAVASAITGEITDPRTFLNN
jgi:3-isopropylmalate/(R)-2-methylmalate dehydratase large subunit